jgi:hypothetical protein
MRLIRASLALSLAAAVSACATSGPVINSGCEWAFPIYTSKDDILTDGTADQILALDEAWKKVCK